MSTFVYICIFLLDLSCLLLAFLPYALFTIFNVSTPFKRGFFCDDQRLSYPYVAKSTVPSYALYVVGLGVGITSIVVVELVLYCTIIVQSRTSVFRLIWTIYRLIAVFLLGFALTISITYILKYSVGRLRPHFFQVCEPKTFFDIQNKVAICPKNFLGGYIKDYECTFKANVTEHTRKNIYLSFPSGHASYSTYAMVFIALYLQSRLVWNWANLVRPLFQFILISLAAFTCASRVTDFKHHWEDVIFGFLLGFFIALYMVFHQTSLFPTFTKADDDDNETISDRGEIELPRIY